MDRYETMVANRNIMVYNINEKLNYRTLNRRLLNMI